MILAGIAPGISSILGEGLPAPSGNVEAQLPKNIFPLSATLLTVDNKDKLQQELDEHRAVRLMPGDYGAGPITLRSGQQLYGLPGTRVGRIVIEPGASGAMVSGVQSNVVFPASDAVTKGNTIFRIGGAIIVKGGALEDNLFVDAQSLDVDVTTGGYLRNNRFIRAPGQMQGNSMLKFRASPERPSTGNVFLWMNAGGNQGPTTEITGVTDLTMAVVDAEMWSFKTKEPVALFVTGPMQRLNIFAVQGGRYDGDLELRKKYGLIDSAARELRVFGLTPGYRGQAPDTLPAKIVLRDGNERSMFVDSVPYSFSMPATSNLQLRAFEQLRGVPEGGLPPISNPNPNQQFIVTPAGAEQKQQAALQEMILQTGRTMRPWERPGSEPVPDPAGDKWNQNLASAKDDTQMLQDRLDKEGIAVLAAGKYHISAPLRINRGKGLVGSGMDQTVIIAKDPNLSMFVYDPQGDTRAVSLANLTLQGGRVGVHLRGEDTSGYINKSFLANITFRNMSEAGVYVDMLDGKDPSMDNNLISFCNFVNCGAGLKQRPHQNGRSGFIDKLVVYRCQFIQCGLGIDFPARRSNNACAYIECRFADNMKGAAKLDNNTTPVFANCDFTGNAGDPAVASNQTVYFMSCNFQTGANSQSLLPSKSISEGCVFESAKSPGAVLVKKASRNTFYNCRVEMPLGQLKDALFLNSKIAGQPGLSQIAAQILDGKTTVLMPGTPKPGPQLLVKGNATGKTDTK